MNDDQLRADDPVRQGAQEQGVTPSAGSRGQALVPHPFVEVYQATPSLHAIMSPYLLAHLQRHPETILPRHYLHTSTVATDSLEVTRTCTPDIMPGDLLRTAGGDAYLVLEHGFTEPFSLAHWDGEQAPVNGCVRRTYPVRAGLDDLIVQSGDIEYVYKRPRDESE